MIDGWNGEGVVGTSAVDIPGRACDSAVTENGKPWIGWDGVWLTVK
ncbi:MAG: hypothetical protein NTZ17_21780 [Phycisphaerae bacterium]|nr:hypothetical protein [Phycisphaerae bacterium]